MFKECQTAIYTLPIFLFFVEKVLCLRFHVIDFLLLVFLAPAARCLFLAYSIYAMERNFAYKLWRKCDWSVRSFAWSFRRHCERYRTTCRYAMSRQCIVEILMHEEPEEN
jgi:hypothetical protein